MMETRGMLSSASASDCPVIPEDEANKTGSQPTSCPEKVQKNSNPPANGRRRPSRTPRPVVTTVESFQKEIDKWEEFYDDMKTYLTDGTLNPRNRTVVQKQGDTFFLDSDGKMFFTKTLRDGGMTLKLPVVRSYEDRMEVCRSIHLSTGDECIHNRRDTMLELLGQQYYWKGQRRDVCQCIASCEMCSIGLGGKRRAKPPGQKRDIRPSSKLPRLESSSPPLPSTASRATYTPPPSSSSFLPSPSTPPTTVTASAQKTTSGDNRLSNSTTFHSSLNPQHLSTHFLPVSRGASTSPAFSNTLSLISITNSPPVFSQSTGISNTRVRPRITATQTGPVVRGATAATPQCTSPSMKPQTFPIASNSAFTPVDPLANLYTIAEACLLNNTTTSSSSLATSSTSSLAARPPRANPEISVASEVTVSDSSGLQIFTTIDEPYYNETHEGAGNTRQRVVTGDQETGLPSSVCASVVTGPDCGVGEEYVVQGNSSCGETAVDEVESSIYQLLFQLPSVPNTTICTAVIESMQMALKCSADPCQLAQAASQSLSSVFELPPSSALALVSPCRGAAYITSLSSVLSHQELLNPRSACGNNSTPPPIVLHDTICENGSPNALSSLLGAYNWNLGTHTLPMDRELLQASVTSNRVTAVLYRPFAYPPNTNFLSLQDILSVCHPRGVSVIVDCSIGTSNTLPHLKSIINEMLMTGADLIMLPNTEHFQGPPHTCILVGNTSLLAGYWERLALLQPFLPFPLSPSPYDTVGSVVAFKSLQVSGIKSEPMN